MEEDKKSFDQQWNDAFTDAEITPPEHVWTAIDGKLSNSAANSYKKQLVIYRWLAAACLLLLILFGWGYLPNYTDQSKSIVSNDDETSKQHALTSKNKIVDGNTTSKAEQNSEGLNTDTKFRADEIVQEFNSKEVLVSKSILEDDKVASNNSKDENESTTIIKKSTKNKTNSKSDNVESSDGYLATSIIPLKKDKQNNSNNSSTDGNVITEFEDSNNTPISKEGDQMITNQHEMSQEILTTIKQSVEEETQREEIFNSKMESKKIANTITSSSQPPKFIYGVPVIPSSDDLKELNRLWAGVVMSTGAFNPSINLSNADSDEYSYLDEAPFEPSTIQEFSEQRQIQDINEEATVNHSLASSISGGIAVGTRVRNRIIVSSGIGLNTITTNQTSTSLISQDGVLYALTGDESDNSLTSAINDSDVQFEGATVSLSNEYKYLSIPIKAGYILLDKQFNITLNTGVSSNFLLGSQLVSGDSDQFINNNLDTRDNYQGVYFNFLTSIEFGYLIASKYQLSLEPNYNRAFTNFTESNNLDNRKPSNLGIILGLKYNF